MDLKALTTIAQSVLSTAQVCILAQLVKNQSTLDVLDSEDRQNNAVIQKLLQLIISQSQQRVVWRHPFSTDWWDHKVPEFPENLFIRHFRVNFEVFEFIVQKLRNVMHTEDTRFRDAIPIRKKIAVALKLLGTTCDYLTVAALFGIGRSTAHKCFHDFISAAYNILVPDLIQFPKTENDYKKLAADFESYWQFYMAIGAIDGSHIPFRAPTLLATDFYNYKGWHSVLILAICDAHGNAIWIKAGMPGRQSDSGAFKQTKLFKKITEGLIPPMVKEVNGVEIPLLLLGDSGFGLEPWLMKPFTHHSSLNDIQRLFNSRLSRARRIVENFFGMLKGRWRRLYRGIDVHYKNAHKVVAVAAALHNLCQMRKVKFRQTPFEIEENRNFEHQNPQPNHQTSGSTLPGEELRRKLMSIFQAEDQPWEM